MRSMTGYGRAQLERDGREVTVEIRTVNHRFLDVSLRLPRALSFAEDDARRQIAAALTRGHADVAVAYANRRADARRVTVDPALAAAYREAFRTLSETVGSAESQPPLEFYAQLPDVLSVREAPEDAQALGALLREALAEALEGVESMRRREGEALKRDLLGYLTALEEIRQRMLARAPQVTEEYRRRLCERLAQLDVGQLDAQRLAQEVALFADRAAIDEELARLEAHIAQAERLIAGDAPCGSRLNFLAQEMNREANTAASKAQDAALAQEAVEAKTVIEKLREQIQNVE